jgi:hypothetical protein
MTALYEGRFWVHYGQAYVISGGWELPDMTDAFRGQVNGLCGAADPGRLFLVTGLHTGDVNFRVELLEKEPLLDEAWEEAVEVSFSPAEDNVALAQWAGQATFPLAIPTQDYRVRYCARGMQTAREADTILQGANPLDSYVLTFWPAAAAPDRILRQTSGVAAYWHRLQR